jgi:hypothetical protein
MKSIIFDVSEINKVNFSQVIQTPETLVYNINKNKTYVSWTIEGEPSFMRSIISREGPYDNDQLHPILENYEWLLIV